jgi:hypothetical protein
MVPVERIELPTFGLQNRCSTAELNRLRCVTASVYGGWVGVVNTLVALVPGRTRPEIRA